MLYSKAKSHFLRPPLLTFMFPTWRTKQTAKQIIGAVNSLVLFAPNPALQIGENVWLNSNGQPTNEPNKYPSIGVYVGKGVVATIPPQRAHGDRNLVYNSRMDG